MNRQILFCFFLFSFFFFLLSFFFFLFSLRGVAPAPSAKCELKKKNPKKKILFALRASCQRFLLSAIWKRKTENIFLFALRASCPRLLPNANRNRKAGKKKVAASRFVLAPSAKCEMKKKDQKLVVRKRRGCFFCAWRIVLLVSWLRLGETESNSSLFC